MPHQVSKRNEIRTPVTGPGRAITPTEPVGLFNPAVTCERAVSIVNALGFDPVGLTCTVNGWRIAVDTETPDVARDLHLVDSVTDVSVVDGGLVLSFYLGNAEMLTVELRKLRLWRQPRRARNRRTT